MHVVKEVQANNPNYDYYACQRNTFLVLEGGRANAFNGRMLDLLYTNARVLTDDLIGVVLLRMGADQLQINVDFSMPRMNLELDKGNPLPPSGVRELLNSESEMQSVGYNAYLTHKIMVFGDANGSGVVAGGANGNRLMPTRNVKGCFFVDMIVA